MTATVAVATGESPVVDPPAVVQPRLLSGPPAISGAESIASHVDRLGERPLGGHWLIDVLEAADLRGRGGGAFPAGRKWRSVHDASPGRAAVIINAAEGEPLSGKDRVLLSTRPHLVLDGAALAGETLGASVVHICINRAFRDERRALEAAIRERRRLPGPREPKFRIVTAPDRYVAGESSALVNLVNGHNAKPTQSPPSPHESGVAGRPTLVQNCETICQVALLARFGARYFIQDGQYAVGATVLVTVTGAVRRPGVFEVGMGSRIGDVIDICGRSPTAPPQAVLLGGYFGGWMPWAEAVHLRLDNAELKASGTSLGCGVIAVLPGSACGLVETSHMLRFLALETAGQCGPCVYGLAAIANAFDRLAQGTGDASDLGGLRRWASQIANRGACHHPDGALRLLNSALRVFAPDVEWHLGGDGCPGARRFPALPLPPEPGGGWT
jgi:NADH:ubiquinone oxidoreductase subunit F (NADH-binding)